MQSQALERLFALASEQAEDAEVRLLLKEIEAQVDGLRLSEELLVEKEDIEPGEEEAYEKSVSVLIRNLSIPEKIKLALKGNSSARTLLIRDSNKLIPMFVLENPRLTDSEVQEFARNKELDEGVLREISKNSTWMRLYSVKHSIVANPKTPIDVSLKWVKFLQDKDLRLLAKSKNIPQVLAGQCRKALEKRNS